MNSGQLASELNCTGGHPAGVGELQISRGKRHGYLVPGERSASRLKARPSAHSEPSAVAVGGPQGKT